MKTYRVGDLFIIDAEGTPFAPEIECIVMEVGDDGRAIKVKAVHPDERLLSIGWFKEGDDYVIFEYDINYN